MTKNIAKELIESFDYVYNEDTINQMGVKNSPTSTLTKPTPSKPSVGKNISNPIYIAMAIYDGYQEITKLPDNIPKNQYKTEVTKIIAKLVADYGVMWVGSILGGMVGGAITGGPGAIVGMMAGGILSSYALGDDVSEIVDKVVDKLYEPDNSINDQNNTPTPSDTNNTTQIQKDIHDSVSELQKQLINNGFSVGNSGIDGKFGPNTVGALLAFQKKNNISTSADAIAALMGIKPDTQPLSESEIIAKFRDVIDIINEGAVGQHFVIGILGKKPLSDVRQTPNERAKQFKQMGYSDAYRDPNTIEKTANLIGRGTRGTILGITELSANALKLTGYALRYAKNHTFLAIVAGVGLYGYYLDPNGNIVSNLINNSDSLISLPSNQYSGEEPTTDTTGEPSIPNQIDRPQTGFDKIRDIQKKLIELGYPISATGVMDKKTKDAYEWEYGSSRMKGSQKIRNGLSDIISKK